MACTCDPAALEKLDEIVSRAFSISDGYLELNFITFHAVGFDLFNELGDGTRGMELIVSDLRAALSVDDRGAKCLRAMFEKLPGNGELREWIRANSPTLLDLVPQAVFEAARPPYEKDRLDRRMKSIDTGLTALAPEVGLGNTGKALAREMLARLDDLAGYKKIHDELHTLQMNVLTEFLRNASENFTPAQRRSSSDSQLMELELASARIGSQFGETTASTAALEARDAVIAKIEQIIAALGGSALDQRETSLAAASLLRKMLRPQMSLFDSRLVEASQQIPFTKFANLLRTLPPGPDPALLSDLSKNFADVEVRLVLRRSVHRLWQQVEATVLNVEDLITGTGTEMEFEFHMQDLTERIGEIATLSNDPRIAELLKLDGLTPGPEGIRSEGFRAAFASFAQAARVRFQIADFALLDDCGQLKKLHAPLEILLGDQP